MTWKDGQEEAAHPILLSVKVKHGTACTKGNQHPFSLRRGCPLGKLAEGPLFQKRGFLSCQYCVSRILERFWNRENDTKNKAISFSN